MTTGRIKPLRYRATVLCCGLLAAAPALADICSYRDAQGVLHISNVCDRDSRFRVVMATPHYQQESASPDMTPASTQLPPGISLGPMPPSSASGISAAKRALYTPAIRAVAAQYGLEPALLHAVISAESAYEPLAVSRAGAMGLMQLMPDTAARFGVVNAFDPAQNLQGGARYLRWLLDQFQQLSLAVAAYNAGENSVIRNGYAIPPFQETQTYVARVLDYYNRYRHEY
ncbi:lytic transglycosylase domain-containing protein [Plasticicumulans acidivorans]|uniref:Transglycosylase-like protein with SLT domain n=1 Tax=Plasticicumulans acidivorans TaxID=886464 RepID=A0A317MX96_9GAMM|nr:lytic transglycosylase domain-containing protein [Plasticicumulans acidivorans]PWV63247.1 transglycosylase-like protein with SLT domain [Plasticicumulans acidivorans]